MLRRLINSWRRFSAATERSEAHLTSLVELLAASEARNAALGAHVERQLALLNSMDLHLARLERQITLADPRFSSPLRLERFGHKVSSQNDEDGIIAEIFRRIGTTARVFVEIAAGDGRENCSAFLLSQGWRGLWVECDDARIKSIEAHCAKELERGQLKLSAERVTPDVVNDIIARADLGDEIDLFILDIDGNDYHVLEALKARPRVICAEYFGLLPPPVHWVMSRNDDFVWPGMDSRLAIGATLQAFDNLLAPRGYSLVGTSLAGVNCFFVRSDLVGDKFAAPFTAANHYNPPRYWYGNISVLSPIWPEQPEV